MEDYVNLLSKSTFYLTYKNRTFTMRTLKQDLLFNQEEETTTAMHESHFRCYLLTFFCKEMILFLVAAFGKCLQVDLAMKNQTRPSCTRVKVEIGLLKEFPKHINVGLRKKSGEMLERWININYDYVPKCYKNCKIQWHDKQRWYVLYPELYPKDNVEETRKENKEGKGKP